MNNILPTILSVSISGSVLTLLILLMKPLIKNRVSKAFSYYIWLLVMLRLMLPFGYDVSVPGISQLLSGQSTQGYTAAPAAVRVLAGQTGDEPRGDANASVPQNTKDEGQKNAANVPEAAGGSGLWSLMGKNLFWIWLSGAAVSFFWYVAAYAAFSRKLSQSFTEPGGDDLKVFRKMVRGKRVRLARSGIIDTPMLMGVLRPVVVLPQSAFTAEGAKSGLYGVLSHELTHYKRHDIAYKWLVVFVTSLHWFNPLVYHMRRQIDDACELSCDEAVIKKMSASERKYYGNTLLSLATKRRLPGGAMATTLCQGKKQLKGRLISIMSYKNKNHAAAALMVAIALTLTGCAAGITSVGGGKVAAPKEGAVTAPGKEYGTPKGTAAPSDDKDKSGGAASPDAAGKNQEHAQVTGDTSSMEAYKAVLQGKTEFFSTDADKNLNMSQLNQAVSTDGTVTAKAIKFAVADLDGDGSPELILVLSVNGDDYYGYEILRYGDKGIYGYTVPYRAFMDLKANGTFSFSSGAADSGFGTIKFSGNTYSVDGITYSKSSYDSNNDLSISYFVNRKSATKDAFDSALDAQSRAAGAEWYDYTDKNIGAVLK